MKVACNTGLALVLRRAGAILAVGVAFQALFATAAVSIFSLRASLKTPSLNSGVSAKGFKVPSVAAAAALCILPATFSVSYKPPMACQAIGVAGQALIVRASGRVRPVFAHAYAARCLEHPPFSSFAVLALGGSVAILAAGVAV